MFSFTLIASIAALTKCQIKSSKGRERTISVGTLEGGVR